MWGAGEREGKEKKTGRPGEDVYVDICGYVSIYIRCLYVYTSHVYM